MKQLFIYLLLISSITATAQKSAQMKWMTGTWKIIMEKGSIMEEWKTTNDSTLTGKSFFITTANDTIPQENIELIFANGDWYYTPTVKKQNNSQPVVFKIILLKGTEFISENPAHDFPQRIAYRRIKQQLFASIEGKKNGRYSKQNFDFTGE
jgi:Domain of unknown function (DUF6265)